MTKSTLLIERFTSVVRELNASPAATVLALASMLGAVCAEASEDLETAISVARFVAQFSKHNAVN